MSFFDYWLGLHGHTVNTWGSYTPQTPRYPTPLFPTHHTWLYSTLHFRKTVRTAVRAQLSHCNMHAWLHAASDTTWRCPVLPVSHVQVMGMPMHFCTIKRRIYGRKK
jgi:hypothetical protein